MLGRTLLVMAALAAAVQPSDAETRGTLRFGVMPLELVASSETPLFGSDVTNVVDKYNAAAAAHDQMSGGRTARLEATDLAVAETLLVFTPGLELGAGPYFFRIEVPLGIADDLKSLGVGVYPLNLQAKLRPSTALYVSAGGSASWLDRPGTGDIGGLLSARVAGGLRVARHVVVEVGYNAFVLGGSYNNERLEDMANGTAMEVVAPDQVISAGEARGIIDASLGVAF